MKKKVLVTVLVLGIVVGTAMAQQNMHMKTTDQSMHQGQGMHQGQNMHQGHGMMGGGMGMDMNCSRMMGNMNAANQQKFLNETKELRKQMQMKRFEYMEARRNPNANPQDINNLEQEMFNLSEKMKK
ncbi:MAG: hypothetical protein DRP14_03615 [Candidatus Aenigmatarchaeota archaeon]|nr:MAG: hypothetical protein DRP14_03615 [Candidatus Aenigmarchaeota archaeon]